MTPMTISWYILWPIIFLHMVLVIKLTLLPTGGLFISASFGGSVANANAPRVSIIKLTQSNWTAVKGADPECCFKDPYHYYYYHYCCCCWLAYYAKAQIRALHEMKRLAPWANAPEMHAETKFTTSATTLTVNWNCTNFWMFIYTARPHLATFTIVAKLSSIMMTSAFSLATYR